MEKYSLEPYKDKAEVSDFRKEEAYTSILVIYM